MLLSPVEQTFVSCRTRTFSLLLARMEALDVNLLQ